MDIKGYIFDYGGTIDTQGCHWGQMIWHAYERQQVPVEEYMFREAYVFAERTLGKNPIIQPDYTFHKTLEVKLRIEFDYLIERGYLNEGNFRSASLKAAVLNDLYDRVKTITSESRKVLTSLKKRYPLVLVSNFYGNMDVVLQEFGLDGIFDGIVESAVVGIRKPNPEIFKLGVKALKLNEDSVAVVGDSIDKDIVPAKKAGCFTIWLKGEGWNEQPDICAEADKYITSLRELLEDMQ